MEPTHTSTVCSCQYAYIYICIYIIHTHTHTHPIYTQIERYIGVNAPCFMQCWIIGCRRRVPHLSKCVPSRVFWTSSALGKEKTQRKDICQGGCKLLRGVMDWKRSLSCPQHNTGWMPPMAQPIRGQNPMKNKDTLHSNHSNIFIILYYMHRWVWGDSY